MSNSPLYPLICRARVYAGIGTRTTSPHTDLWLERIAAFLARKRITLRSGAAQGADAAFERGCDHAEGKKEIFLPWPGFNDSPSPLHPPPPEAEALAAEVHPHWSACSRAARRLHARNCQQVLGQELNDPVDFVLVYAEATPEGGARGGSATAVSIAHRYGIPVYNLQLENPMALWQAITREDELGRVAFWRRLLDQASLHFTPKPQNQQSSDEHSDQ